MHNRENQRTDSSGANLPGWSLAINRSDDLVFLHTNGYSDGYFINHKPEGGVRFISQGFTVKSRDSDAEFTVLAPHPNFTAPCTRDSMVKWAKWWGGYEVLGAEKEYYLNLIRR